MIRSLPEAICTCALIATPLASQTDEPQLMVDDKHLELADGRRHEQLALDDLERGSARPQETQSRGGTLVPVLLRPASDSRLDRGS